MVLLRASLSGAALPRLGRRGARQLRASLRTAVTRQMVADVEVGAFLSGGLDSSAVVAFARGQARNGRLACFTIETSHSAAEEGFVDDLPYARKVAAHLGIELHTIRVGPEIVDRFEKMIWHLDEPQADLAPLNALRSANWRARTGSRCCCPAPEAMTSSVATAATMR